MAKISYIAVHHSGGLVSDPFAPTQHLTVDDVDRAHRARWPDFKSALGYFVGYNIVILLDGSWKQTRKIGEETAAQRGHNFDTISICLMGNFSLKDGFFVEMPTDLQVRALKRLLIGIYENQFDSLGLQVVLGTRVAVPLAGIVPHRVLHPTECYGTSLADNWARNFVVDYVNEKIGLLRQLLALWLKLIDLQRGGRKMLVGIGKRLGLVMPESCFDSNNRG
jgi:hypothetical protein